MCPDKPEESAEVARESWIALKNIFAGFCHAGEEEKKKSWTVFSAQPFFMPLGDLSGGFDFHPFVVIQLQSIPKIFEVGAAIENTVGNGIGRVAW